MIALIITIITMFVGLFMMYITDNNRKKYTDYQIKNILSESKIFSLVR